MFAIIVSPQTTHIIYNLLSIFFCLELLPYHFAKSPFLLFDTREQRMKESLIYLIMCTQEARLIARSKEPGAVLGYMYSTTIYSLYLPNQIPCIKGCAAALLMSTCLEYYIGARHCMQGRCISKYRSQSKSQL